MGKIAKIIRKYYGAILDTYYYLDGELEKTAYKIPEKEIIELIENEVIPAKDLSFNEDVMTVINECHKNLKKLKEE